MAKPRDRADGPPSTAWLAAQEAFSAPRPAAVEPALVVVRKGRAPELVSQADVPSAIAVTVAAVERPARVFRVVAEAAFGTAAAVDTALVDAAGAMPEARTAASAAPARRRKRRLDLHKHPGPVTHILQLAAAPTESETPPHSLSPGEEIAAMQAAMSHVDAVFDEISRARAFRFVD